MKGAQHDAGRQQAVGGIGLGQGAFGGDDAEGVEGGGALDAVQKMRGDLPRAQSALPDLAADLKCVSEM